MAGTQPPVLPEEPDFASVPASGNDFSAGTSDSYKEIAVISGKGGSGKTTVIASLALLADNKVLADNDVDAADLHLLLNPSVREAHDFVGGVKAIIDPSLCTGCGMCADACHFDAIHPNDPTDDTFAGIYRVDAMACEGCGLCKYICEYGAVDIASNVTGRWYISNTDHGPMVHARLGIAEENSGRLVTHVRNVASDLAVTFSLGYIFGDGPPGTSCPVIASVTGADLIMIVTEPTVSGVHDMQRVLELIRHFGIPALIVINKADLNLDQSERIEHIAEEMGVRIIGRIPFDRNVHDALMASKTVIEYNKGPAYRAVIELWGNLNQIIS
ncbi:ATP-binding protein [bacterium]|nr:ATP-binding protein [candidate division CSSED10-310 bacterium]